jgi:transcriptional regulator GlxA family with amidase domain
VQYDFDNDDSFVIVVAPADVSDKIARHAVDVSVVAFRSLDELDRWRLAYASRNAPIRGDVVDALREIGSEIEALSARLRPIFEEFCERSTVPALAEVEQSRLSRRSLYRIWTLELREGPSRFLRRVRVLHAERLMRDGVAPKEAAMLAGFGSVDHLRRLRARRREAFG